VVCATVAQLSSRTRMRRRRARPGPSSRTRTVRLSTRVAPPSPPDLTPIDPHNRASAFAPGPGLHCLLGPGVARCRPTAMRAYAMPVPTVAVTPPVNQPWPGAPAYTPGPALATVFTAYSTCSPSFFPGGRDTARIIGRAPLAHRLRDRLWRVCSSVLWSSRWGRSSAPAVARAPRTLRGSPARSPSRVTGHARRMCVSTYPGPPWDSALTG